MKSILAVALLAFVSLASTVAAQEPATQDRAAALKESLAQNQAALRQYTWLETTKISLKGEVKKQEQKQCSYGADGKVQKTPLAGAPAQEQQASSQGRGRRGGGRLKKTIVENKVEELKDYMEHVAALVHEYVPPDRERIQAAQAAGNVSVQPSSGGAVVVTVKNYAKTGDSLAIGFDTAAKKLSSYHVNSYVEKPKDDDVTLTVTFARLEDGTAYPQHVVIDAKAKHVQVDVTNSGYKK
jgi:hypothetical protein